MDRLIVKGLNAADGEYAFDLFELIDIGAPGALDTREQHKVKLSTGVLPMDLRSAVGGLDAAVMVTLASIVIARFGKRVNDERLWDARLVYGNDTARPPDISADKAAVCFVIAKRAEGEDEEGGADDGPPAEASKSSQSGGSSSEPTSVSPVKGQSATGLHALQTSATSDPETLAI